MRQISEDDTRGISLLFLAGIPGANSMLSFSSSSSSNSHCYILL